MAARWSRIEVSGCRTGRLNPTDDSCCPVIFRPCSSHDGWCPPKAQARLVSVASHPFRKPESLPLGEDTNN